MKIYLASGNVHKKQEMARIFSEHTIVLPYEEGVVFDPEETGSSFLENSMIKAEALWRIVHAPVLADDSGICVDILGGKPGIYSARYHGAETGTHSCSSKEKLSDEERNELLIAEVNFMQKIALPEQKPRSCRFVCALVLYLTPCRFFTAQEVLEGTLLDTSEGAGGFGYDPIVYLREQGKTVAELLPEEKNTLSHRAKAGAALKKIINSL